ncbi:MAG: anthranilate synthase component 1, partial [Gemmatimonadales bacterium]
RRTVPVTPQQPAVGTVLPLVRRLPANIDPLALYRALTRGGQQTHTFLLESADGSERHGHRSLLGVRAALRIRADLESVRIEPLSPNGPAAQALIEARYPAARYQGDVLVIPIAPRTPVLDERDRYRQSTAFDVLRTLAFGVRLTAAPNPWGHLLVGAFGYDAIDYFERLPHGSTDPLDQPVLEFWVPDRLIVLDHPTASATVVATAWGGPGFDARYHDASHAVEQLVASLKAVPGSELPSEALFSEAADCDVTVDQSDNEYAETVTRLQQHILAGDVYQIVPSRTFSLPCADPLSAYAALRARNPSPYLFYLQSPERTLFGASPETCLRVDASTRMATITPIAGTVGRGRNAQGQIDPDADVRAEVMLRLDQKEMAEHLMLVDLARNDIARISVPGTRTVTRLLQAERYTHVMHLVSEVSGTLNPDTDALEAYAATMNMGTLVGAPKVRAAQLLRSVEPSRRGSYGGGIGYLRSDGTLETAIVIRSAVVVDGIAHVRAGAGVVMDSDPASEALETRRKARAVIEAIRSAEVPAHV